MTSPQIFQISTDYIARRSRNHNGTGACEPFGDQNASLVSSMSKNRTTRKSSNSRTFPFRRPAGSSRPAQQNPASLVNLLQLWLSQGGLPGNRQLRLSRCHRPSLPPTRIRMPFIDFSADGEGITCQQRKSLLRSARRLLRQIRERTN